MTIPTRLTPDDMARAPLTPGRLSRLALDTGEIELRYYAPQGEDKQVPHERDELYFVVRGSGAFLRGAQRVSCGAGDVLFAAAGEPHRFVDFSADFSVWVLFYGAVRKAG
jgi:mannose-6-phosphate isomerase-like protein (cupin superfamily)